jgi:hypothetical protein
MRFRWLTSLMLLTALGCTRTEAVYMSCDVPEDCQDFPEGAEPACLPKEGEGFCTWLCATDPDCEADDSDGLVCASFEEQTEKYCFPSCEGGDELCPAGMNCRSTGGGVENRRVCFPVL